MLNNKFAASFIEDDVDLTTVVCSARAAR